MSGLTFDLALDDFGPFDLEPRKHGHKWGNCARHNFLSTATRLGLAFLPSRSQESFNNSRKLRLEFIAESSPEVREIWLQNRFDEYFELPLVMLFRD